VARHASALKKDRQALRRRERNRAGMAALKTVVKKVRAAADGKNGAAARAALAEAVPALSKAAAKKLIHKNRASRLISRLTRRTNRTSSPAAS